MKTPNWVADAVFYQIFPDRFASSRKLKKPAALELWEAPATSHGYKGGDLLGVAEHLDYLKDLGVNALYFNPIFTSSSNHRYHTTDYFQVDPLLGGNAAFKNLLTLAKKKGFRVILDGVFNHTGRAFHQFTDVLENGARSPYKDWYHFNPSWLQSGHPLNPYPKKEDGPGESIDKYGYKAWWNLPALPKLNVANPEVRDYIYEVAKYWIDFGVDGWRLDVPEEIHEKGFWEEFRNVCKKANPDAYIVGEIWGDASVWLKGDRFDGVMNYLLTKCILGLLIRNESDFRELKKAGGYGELKPLTHLEFKNRIEKVFQLYPWPATLAQLNLLGSHDVARIYTGLGGDRGMLKLAYFLLFMLPGAPCIYYGDEIGMKGGHDPGCREAFPRITNERDMDIHAFFKKCLQIRHKSKALRRGKIKFVEVNDQYIIFTREMGTEKIVVVLNVVLSPQHITLPKSVLGQAKSVTDLMNSKKIVISKNSPTQISCEGKSGMVFQVGK